MSELHADQLFMSSLLRARDVHCRAKDTRRSGEEQAEADTLVFTRAGVFQQHRLADGRGVIAEPAHVVFFDAWAPYCISHPTGCGDECTSIEYPREVVLDALEPFDPDLRDRKDRLFRYPTAPVAPALALEVQRFRQELRRTAGAPSSLAAEELGFSVLRHAIAAAFRASHPSTRGRRRTDDGGRTNEKVEKTRLLVAARPSSDDSLMAIASAVSSSPYHLARLFRDAVGISIHQYRLRLRLAIALDHVVDGVRGAPDLSALALDLGFAHHSHFTSAFRRAFGVTPSTMRRVATTAGVKAARRALATLSSDTRTQ